MTKSIRTRFAFCAGTAILATALAGCAGGGAQQADADGTAKVAVGAVFTTATVPLWIAEQEGFFEDHDLDVTISQNPNFAASAPALLSGQLQFANAATGPVVTAVDEKMPLQILAGVSAQPDDPALGDDQVLVPADGDVERPADLEGLTVATNAVGSGPYIGVMANYLADGGAPGGIEWVVMNLNEQLPALEDGQIDAAVLSEPFTAGAVDAGFREAFNAYQVPGLDLIPGGFTDAVVVTSDEYAEKNPEIVARMHDALIEANDFAQDNPDTVRDILQEKLEMDADVVEKIKLPAFIGEVRPADIQSMVDAMSDLGLIENDLNADDFVWHE